MKDAGRIGFVIRGEYSDTETYDFLDVVFYNRSSYVAKKETMGNPPARNDEFWQMLAESSNSTSLVMGVKGEAEEYYRDELVNITKKDIGLGNVEDTADAEKEVKHAETADKAKGDEAGNDIAKTYLTKTGDAKDNTVTFESEDEEEPAEFADMPLVESKNPLKTLFHNLSIFAKNLRYIWKIMGSTDISQTGDGTVTGILALLIAALNGFSLEYITEEEYNALEEIDDKTIYFISES